MSTFGKIKTNIENTASELVKSPNFKRFMFEFNGLVLNNKDICELYQIYDDLTENKGMSTDIVNDYINESIEYSQILLESQSKNISYLNSWIKSWNKSNENRYSDIDNAIYSKGIRNLESILESKKNIKNILIKEDKNLKENKEVFNNMPISSMVKIANNTLKEHLNNINEEDKKELNDILSISYEELKENFNSLKENVLNNLKSSINESTDNDLQNTINKTITKVVDAKCNYYDYYKLKKLSFGL